MRIALTGISGFIGSVIARRLNDAGHTVTGLVRDTSRRDHVAACADRFVVGAQDDESAWPELLRDADCVIHNSVDWRVLEHRDLPAHFQSNLAGTLKLLHASAPRRFIFISTIAVHHDMRPRWEGRIDEDHPTRPGSLYGAYKAAVEAHLWAARAADGREVCALRPCGVYGIDPKLNRSIGYPIVKALKRHGRFSKAGGGKFVHVEDVAAAAVAAVDSPVADGCVVNLADCYARWGDLARMAAEAMGLDAEIDMTSPPRPTNSFTKTAAHTLGVPLDRGHDGLREHMAELIEAMDAEER